MCFVSHWEEIVETTFTGYC